MNEPYRQLLSAMTEGELSEHIAALRTERDRLAELYRRDLAALSAPSYDGYPLGKLRPRLPSTKEKWKACRARQTAAESELTARRARSQSDWDEPTDTDLERLRDKLRAT